MGPGNEGLVRLIGAVVCLVMLRHGSNCQLSRAMDGRIPRRSITSSRQSAATSKIVERCFPRVNSCKQRYKLTIT